MIVPIVEEVLIAKKQLRLKEELHIIRKQTAQKHQEELLLRREEIVVEPICRPHLSGLGDLTGVKSTSYFRAMT